MNKSELSKKLALRNNMTKKKAGQVVELIFDAMTDALVRWDRIEIRGFGSFKVKHYDSYQGRNPRTGDVTEVAPKKLPFFKVGRDLRERVDTLF